MEKSSIIMLCGLPGAGKTTLAKQLEKESQAVRLCPDEWIFEILEDHKNITERDRLRNPIEKLLFEHAQKLVNLGINVILENGFWTRQDRDSYRDKSRESGAKVELHFLDVDFNTLWERVSERNKNLQGTFMINQEELKEWHKLFEPPTQEELQTYDSFKKYD